MKSFLLLAFIASAASVFAQNHHRYHVRQNASGANDGANWQDAFTDLHAALNVSHPGDTIWVAAGTYVTSPTGDRSVSFQLKSGIRVYGGFAGTETALSERDWVAHPTILSGAISGIYHVDDARHIMFVANPDSNTTVDGLVFKNGFSDSNNSLQGGAALFVLAEDSIFWKSEMRIRNCRFDINRTTKAGGAVRVSCHDADFTLFENCIFNYNDAEAGGAVAVNAYRIFTQFIDCQFFQNEAESGGGAVFLNGTFNAARFMGCHFEKNTSAKFGGGAVLHEGAGLPGKSISYSNCHFVENWCPIVNNNNAAGGALYLRILGGADTVSMEHCVFSKNKSFVGAAVVCNLENSAGVHFNLQHCSFEGNDSWLGAAFQLNGVGNGGTVLVGNCLWAEQKGGALAVGGAATSPLGQILMQVDSCRFEDNQNGRVLSHHIIGNTRLDVSNTVFEGNKNADVLYSTAEESNITNCRFEENTGGFWMFTWELAPMNFRNCLFRKNQVFDFMFAFDNGVLNIANCHFDSNHLVNDYSPFPLFIGQANIANSIFTNNTGTPYAVPRYAHPHFEHSYFDAPVANPPATVTFGAGILTGIDPMFQDAMGGDFRLLPCSPLVGAGINTAIAGTLTDLDGLPRIQGGMVDIGVFERAAPRLADAPVTTASCPGAYSGSVVFQPENGCAPYSYAWALDTTSGQNLSDLLPGEYIFTVTDARGSAMSVAVTIPAKPAPVPAPVVSPVLCGDSIGGSAALAVVGLSPFSFAWPDGVADSLRAGLAPGSYIVTVTDADGCTTADTVLIGTAERLSFQFEIGKISCAGAADGYLAVLPQSGKPPFEWLWENGATTPSFSSLGPGIHAGTLTDAFGCQIIWAMPFEEPDAISFETTVVNVSTSMSYDGSITIEQISGGMPPYSIAWSNGASGTTIANLPPGKYGVTVTDANGCAMVEEFKILFIARPPSSSRTAVSAIVFPNPFSEVLSVRPELAPGQESADFVLLNVVGQEIAKAELLDAQTVLHLPDLPAGMYFWQVWRQGKLLEAGTVEKQR